jgi:hypothetical protein
MKLSDVSLHTKVKANYVTRDRATMIGEIVSEEVNKQASGGQFQVLVQYERESSPRWVAGGNLVKITW